jgi:hypothetical protein
MHTRIAGEPPDKTRPEALPSSSIEYAQSQFRVTRRQWRVLTALTLLNTVMLGWFVIGPQSTQFIQSQWRQFQARRAEKAKLRQVIADQRQCLAYTMAEDLVIYEEDPAAALKLLGNRADYSPVRITVRTSRPLLAPWTAPAARANGPPCWTGFAKGGGGSGRLPCDPGLPVVYLGERRTPKGEPRLVVVQFEARPEVNFQSPDQTRATTRCDRELHVSIFAPSTNLVGRLSMYLVLPEQTVRLNEAGSAYQVDPPAALTLLAGQADANDPSHFVLPYRVNGQAGIIDGWLTEEGPLLKPQAGSVTTRGGLRAWKLPVPSAASTQPTTARSSPSPAP